MSPSNQLTREELLEMAELEAIGVLDEYELALFNRAFANAATAVQEEIRNLQASIVADASLLPADEPEIDLKHSVLAAVSQAIDEENEQLAPLATIGGGSRHIQGAASSAVSAFGHMYVWRAATFALAAGLLVCMFFLARSLETSRQLLVTREHEAMLVLLQEMTGSDLRDMWIRKHDARSLQFVTAAASSDSPLASASLGGVALVDDTASRRKASFVVFGLPGDRLETLHIVLVDENGNETRLDSTIQQQSGTTVAIAHLNDLAATTLALLQTGTIEIRCSAGIPVMRSA